MLGLGQHERAVADAERLKTRAFQAPTHLGA
jgi:hypothetical protein